MILKCLMNGNFKAVLICCFVLINLTSSKSISSNESLQVSTSTDINDIGSTTQVYPNTATSVDVTTNSEVASETGSQNVVGDAAATTPPAVVTSSEAYFSDDGAPTDSLPLISTTQTSLHQEVNAVLNNPSAQIDTPIPHLDTSSQSELTLAKDAQLYQLSSDVQYQPSDVGSSTNAPQEQVVDLLNPATFLTDGFIPTTQETSLLQDLNGVQQYPSAQIDTPIPYLDTYTQPDSTLAQDAEFYQNAPQEPVFDLLNQATSGTDPLLQQFPTDVLIPTTQETSLLQDVNTLQQHPSYLESSINAPQDPVVDVLNQATFAADPIVEQFPTEVLIPSTQETSLLQDVNALQHHPSAPLDDPFPRQNAARDESLFQWGSDVQYHPSNQGSSTNTPQEPLFDSLNSGTFAAEPIVQHFPTEVVSHADDAVPQTQPNFTDALTIPDYTDKPNTSPRVMYDDVYDDYGGSMTYDDHLSDDYPAVDDAPEPEEGNYGMEELSESDLEQLDDNDLQELEEVMTSSDDKYDDFGESNVAGKTGYSGEVFDDFEETSSSKHLPFKIRKHRNYLKKNLKQFTNSYGYTKKPSFGGEEAEDDAEDQMNIFSTQTSGQPRKRLYNDRLVALLDIYNKNANRRNLRAKHPKGQQLKYDSKALLQTYDALMQIKHRKMGRKGKYVKSYKSKGNRSKQIRRLQRIRRLMALASKRKSAETTTGVKSGPQRALSTIAKAIQSSSNEIPMLSLSSLQNGIKTKFQHPNEPTNPINNGVLNQINQAMYYHPDVASASLDSTNIQPNPFMIRENQKQQPPVPRFMEYDEPEDVEYEAPETETEDDEGEDDFLNNLFGLGNRGNGHGSRYQNNAALYGSCPAVPIRVSGSKVTVTTSEGCQVVISITGSTDGDGKNLGINVSYNNKVIVDRP